MIDWLVFAYFSFQKFPIRLNRMEKILTLMPQPKKKKKIELNLLLQNIINKIEALRGHQSLFFLSFFFFV